MTIPIMVFVRVSFALPTVLLIASGDYATNNATDVLHISHDLLPVEKETVEQRTTIAMLVEAPDGQTVLEKDKLRRRYAARLLAHANRLLRWYRARTRDVQITELTLAQARRFGYQRTDTQQPWCDDYIVDLPLPPAHTKQQVDIAEVEAAIRNGLLTGTDPELADLYLLDAEQFIREGRFREAVLNCWSVIDATFTTRFERLAKQQLQGEWSEGREAFSSHESSLKHRMSVGMHFVAGRSLFREPGNLWQELTTSYDKRNGIIHRGETADNAEAGLALRVASAVVALMNEVESQAAANAPAI